MHLVQVGETVQSLANLYNVTNVEILRANPEIATGLQPNKVIKIPVKSRQTTTIRPDTAKQQSQQPKQQGDNLHTVQPKETWYGISREYKIPVLELINANPEIDTLKIGMIIKIPKVSEAHKVITGNLGEHTVKPQETLYSLSKQYNTTVEELIRLNPSLSEGLKAGQTIMVPIETEGTPADLKVQVTDTTYVAHRVERKETLYSIAKLYSVQVDDILKVNPEYDGNLRKGDFIRIPRLVKSVQPFAKADTVIMGRDISKIAVGTPSRKPCAETPDNNSVFNIALLVPMQLELVDSIVISDPAGIKGAHEYSAFDFVQFYEGAVIAANNMASKGMKVRLQVFDVDYGEGTIKTRRILNQPELARMDLIIGPFFAESFDLVSAFAQKHQIPIVNPLSRRSGLTKSNEYIIKMQPSTWAQYNTLGKYLRAKHSGDNIIIVKRNQDENSSMINVIKSAITGDENPNVRLKEVNYGATGWSGINNNLSASNNNIVLIATADKAALPAILRDLYAKTETHSISVVGLPEWEDMELDYTHLVKLNTHFFKPWYVDYKDEEVKNFIRAFRAKYVAEPEVDRYAYLGYDVTTTFLSSLFNYGKGFLSCIENRRLHGLSSDLLFIKTPEGGYENYGTTIFKYSDFNREKLK